MNATKKISREPELLSLLLALLLVLLIAIVSYRAWHSFAVRNEQEAASQRVINDTHTLLESLTDAETGQRGFLLTGQDSYLETYEQAVTRLPDLLGTLEQATAARPDQAHRVNDLRPLVYGKLAELRDTIQLRRDQGLDVAVAEVLRGRGKTLMDQIREKCAELQIVSNGRLTRQSEEALSSANQLGLVSTIGSAALFLLLILSTITVRKETALRRAVNQSLRESEAQTRQARDWLQTTIQSIGDGVIATDASGRVTLLNGVAQALTGWTEQQAAGLPLDQVFVISNEETGAAVPSPVAAVLREGRIAGLANHTALTAKDGRRIPIEDSAAPILDEHGKIAGVVMVFRDVSKARATERLEKEAVAAITSQADLLERTNAELRQFANAASHDLREPLRTITALSERLQLRNGLPLDERDAESLKFILAGAKRMSHLIDALLEYSKAGRNRTKPLSPVAMEDILVMVLDNLRESIEESHAVITHDPLPQIVVDEVHAEQLLQNLIGNALKYRREEAPRIHVAARAQSNEWLFSVADNGQGIAPKYQRLIFEPFKRLHDHEYPGAGIGLATCNKVAELYGGRIWVESELGKGSTFLFTVPVTHKAEDDVPRESPSAPRMPPKAAVQTSASSRYAE